MSLLLIFSDFIIFLFLFILLVYFHYYLFLFYNYIFFKFIILNKFIKTLCSLEFIILIFKIIFNLNNI